MARTATSIATIALLCTAWSGCGKHPGTYTTAATPAATASSPVDALLKEADTLFDGRDEEQKLIDALAKYEEAHTADPTNRHAVVRLTRGWYFWGDAYGDSKEVQVERWGKAIEWGTTCIALNAKFASAVNEGKKEKDAVQFAIADDVPCLYWTSTALGKWAKAQSLSKTLKFLPTVKAYMTKTEELDPTYYHYGPARYWGAYYAALPSFAGQDFAKSAEYFAAAVEGAPYYLPTRALRAEYLAVGTQDVQLFDKDVKHVLAADPDSKPEAGITPENIKEREKVQALLDKKYELFDKKALEDAGQSASSQN